MIEIILYTVGYLVITATVTRLSFKFLYWGTSYRKDECKMPSFVLGMTWPVSLPIMAVAAMGYVVYIIMFGED